MSRRRSRRFGPLFSFNRIHAATALTIVGAVWFAWMVFLHPAN